MNRPSSFVDDIRRAISDGRLPERFRQRDVRQACPHWALSTYSTFLPDHRLGNPGGYVVYFERNSDGTYTLA